MDKIYTESEDQDFQESILPEVPEGFLRLTHFTSEDIAKKLVNGEEFSYAKQGILSSTTDAFTNNEEMLKLVQTGDVGAFKRSEFGDTVVLMDIDREECKDRSRIGRCRELSVPNHNILGYILRCDPKELVRNHKYNPIKNELSYLAPGPLPIQQVKQDTLSVPDVDKGPSDV